MAGNWKMYKTPAETRAFFDAFRPLVAKTQQCEILICPPFIDLDAALAATRDSAIEIGAQNLFWAKEGAYTGEVSGPMLKSIGCRWVLIAHSERRQYFGETNESAAKKLAAALEAGVAPVYCVGETLEQRESSQTELILETQVQAALSAFTPGEFQKIVVAYEPVWAIGTGKVATPEMAGDAHRFIRGQLRKLFGDGPANACRILYGGSVKPDNVRGLMAQADIDGALVGGASLDPKSFASIVNF